jgi:hypothetical protein
LWRFYEVSLLKNCTGTKAFLLILVLLRMFDIFLCNTNMSSEISSMFYGAVLHVNKLNVNLYTNPHSWALYCLTALVNTFLWISSVCWNKWLILKIANK